MAPRKKKKKDEPLPLLLRAAFAVRDKFRPVAKKWQKNKKVLKKKTFWAKWGFVSIIWGGVFVAVLLAYYAHDLPSLDKLTETNRKPGIILEARDGTVLSTFGEIYGEYIPYDQLPPALIQAVQATEDRRFFSHFGLDPLGLGRAVFANLWAGGVVQGGSTITQQLAKNVFLSPDRTLKRKVQEAMLALWLERKFSKRKIMELYLNRVYFGAGSYGVDAAARRYYGKPARKLSLKESALLAGLLKAPSRYNPANDPVLAEKRAHQALLNMADAGFLTQQEAESAAQKKLAFRTATGGSAGTLYFADWVMDQLPEFLGHIEEDIRITTTLDAKLQAAAEAALTSYMDAHAAELEASQAALVAMTPEGEIRAMAGGRDYRQSQFNRATQALRQPGSSFKLFVYLAALEQGFSPRDWIEDAPITIGKWRPENYGGEYMGSVTLRQAFAQSLNAAAVRLSENTGRHRVVEMARRLGIESPLSNLPSIALGTSETTLLELTGAYAHVASGGRSVLPHTIREIRGEDGKVLYKRFGGGLGQVLDSSTVAQMDDLLMAVVEQGTGRSAGISGVAIAGKTGTSQDYRDAWFIGFTPALVAGVWMGNDDNRPMKRVTGGSGPARLWREFVSKAPADYRKGSLSRSSGGGGMLLSVPAELEPEQLDAASPSGPGNGTPFHTGQSPSVLDEILGFKNPEAGKVEYDYPNRRRN